MMVTLQATDIPDSVDSLFVTNMTTQRVGRISRVYDDTSLFQNFNGLVNQTRLGIHRVNTEELAHGSYVESKRCDILITPRPDHHV
jgi:hypothetical protein